MRLREDRIGGGCPLEGLTVLVMGFDEMVDPLHELLHAGERASADGLVDLAQEREELLVTMARLARGQHRAVICGTRH